jgi:hypothetical protein
MDRSPGIDIWDGFVDEDGRYAQSGPDVEGQTRRLRTGDGVYFTRAGARKLAHYVEREVQRWLSARPSSVALTIPEEPKVQAPAPADRSGPRARPLAGPVVSLVAERGSEADDLLGGDDRQLAADAMVTKVLVRGEAVTAPAGQADDFVWPRRGVAPVGSGPVVAITDLPMTPMVAERSGTTATTGAATPSRKLATAAVRPAKPAGPPSRNAAATRLCVCAVDVSVRLPSADSARTIQLPIPVWQSMVSGGVNGCFHASSRSSGRRLGDHAILRRLRAGVPFDCLIYLSSTKMSCSAPSTGLTV